MIYFKGADKATNLVELFDKGFSNNNAKLFFVETYSDSLHEVIETLEGKRRSFSDLLEIARTYFPDTTEQQLMLAIKELEMFGVWCNDINKVTFCRLESNDLFTSYNNEKVGVDGYSIDKLKQLLNE